MGYYYYRGIKYYNIWAIIIGIWNYTYTYLSVRYNKIDIHANVVIILDFKSKINLYILSLLP